MGNFSKAELIIVIVLFGIIISFFYRKIVQFYKYISGK